MITYMEEEPSVEVARNMQDETQSKNDFPIKTLLLIVLLTVIAFGLAGFAIFDKFNSEQNRNAFIPSETPIQNPIQTTLTVSSNLIKLSTPSAYSTSINIDTGQDPVNKVQLEISYDPKTLTKIEITPGSFFENPEIFLKNIDPVNGRISFALGVQNGNTGIVGQGILATLSFATLQKFASTSVSLLPKTQVTADGFPQSVLKSTINGPFSLNKEFIKSTGSGK